MGNKGNNRSLPLWAIFMLIFAIICSIIAIIIACIKIDVSFDELEVSTEKMITIAEIIIGVLGVCTTVYFVTMGITLREYKETMETCIKGMKSQLRETYFALSSLESIADEKAIYIRLARGRLLCKSAYSDEDDLQEGINHIQAYYMNIKGSSSVYEDVAVLEKISKNSVLKKEVRDLAKNAIGIIKKNN